MRKVIIIGPIPPPVHGVTVAIKRVLGSQIGNRCRLIHLDTSDHRDVSTIGAADLLNYWHALRSYLLLIAYCLWYRPDVVYVPISQSLIGYLRDSVYLFITRLFSRATIVIHLHGGHFGRFYESSNALTKNYVDFSMGLVGRAIVLGEVFKPIFARWLSAERIDVVPNGTDNFVAGIENKLGLQSRTAHNVTFLSGLMRTKGIVEFVRAALRCLDEEPGLNFRVGGEWWNEDETIKDTTLAAIEERYADRIQFLGLVTGKQKEELFLGTDIFVLPTYYPFEGQPTVIIEAMAAGCPVISTNHAAIPETVIDGETGILIPPRDSGALAEAILTLVHDRATFRQMSKAAYRRYREHYTSEKSNDLLFKSFQSAFVG
ncbi:MAG: glycosyltransferase family 4 protein [Syntrophobacteraceae bacterium]